MAKTETKRGRVPPAKRGTRFYDAELGRWRYKPKGGGPTVDYHSAEGENARRADGRSAPFSARHALRRAGVTVDDAVGRGAKRTREAGAGLLGDTIDSAGIGTLLVYGVGSLLGLILLELALGGNGPAAVDKLLGGLSGGVRKLLDPTDPIIAAGSAGTPPVELGYLPAELDGPAIGAAIRASSSGGGFIPKGASYTPGRVDHGRDFTTTPGGAIIAPGAGKVVKIGIDPSGFGPSYPVVRFTSGPWAGQTVYIGHTTAALKAGDTFGIGAVLARTSKSSGIGSATVPGWVEIGVGVPGTPSYQLGGNLF